MDNEEFQKMIEDAVLANFSGTREGYDMALAKFLDGWNMNIWLAGDDGFNKVFVRLVDNDPTYYGLYINGYLMYNSESNRMDLICKDNMCIHPDDGFSARVLDARVSEVDEDGVRNLVLRTSYLISAPIEEVSE